MSDVAQWLEELGLGQYSSAFAENGVDFRSLPHLTEQDLKDLGVLLGHRRVLLAAISEFERQAAADQAETDKARPSARAEAERRQLTVMFVDLVGSTALSGRLDPEDYRGVIRTYQEACASVVGRYEGFVAKYLGDGILVYFGYPQAHEDDAERAVRAGLGIIKAVAALEPGAGLSLEARVGIATGLVVAGDIVGERVREERAISGETPNLAARLQALAAPGAVVVAEGTQRLLGGVFACEDLGAHDLKGMAELVRAWRVVAERTAESRFEAVRAGRLTPFVGREEEINLLLRRWEQAKQGEGQVVLLAGEAGIGKSRITQALRERIVDEQHTRLRYQCSPHHTSTAFYPFIRQLERAACFTAEDTPEHKLDEIEGLLALGTEAVADVAPLFAALLSVPTGERYPPLELTPQRQKEMMIQAFVDQLLGLAARQPVPLIFEDAHWADPSTLEALEQIIGRVQAARVLAVITFRPEFAPPWHGYTHVTSLTLNRLSRAQCTAMVEGLTGNKALPAEVLEQIVAKTDGVPLFVEELTKAVLESDLLEDAGDRYALRGALPPLAIPSTLQDSLMARLDRLAAVKEIAQIGAVIGREFPYRLLAAVSPFQVNALRDALEQLVESELVFRRGARPDATYLFKHALVQDAAYESLLKSRRQQLHQSVAQALQSEFPATADTEPEILAHHYTQAGLTEPAITYWKRAGQRAAKSSAYAEAIGHCSKGLELIAALPENPERARQELTLQMTLGPALMNVKGQGAPEVEHAYARARDLCQSIGDAPSLFPVLFGLWYFYLVRADLTTARELAKQLLTLADQANDQAFVLAAHRALGQNLCFMGELEPAHDHLQRALALYDHDLHSGLSLHYGQDLAVICCSWEALALWLLGYPDQALQFSQEACEQAEQLAHPYSQAYALNWSAMLHLFRREPSAVVDRAQAMVALAKDKAYAMYVSSGTFWEARVKTDKTKLSLDGTSDEVARMQEGLRGWLATGAGVFHPYFLALLAEAFALLGQTENALSAVDEGLSVIERTGERYYAAELHRLKGEILLCHGDQLDQAEACLQDAIVIARSQSARSLELRAAMNLANLWRERGKFAEARDLLAAIYAWFTEGFDTPDLKDAKALLDELA